MIILGCDLSYTRSAFVWYDATSNKVLKYTTCTIPPGPCRMLRAHDLLRDTLGHGPFINRLVVEGPALNVPNPRTLYMLGELFGVFTMVCESMDLTPRIVSPTELKQFITGSGRAHKEIVAMALRDKWGIKFDDDKGFDLSDAAACCIWGANQL